MSEPIDKEIRDLIRIAARSIAGVDRGEYCQCAEPVSLGMACATCERRIKAEEIRAVIEITGCHDHVPGKQLDGLMCAVCTGWPDWHRHHGVAAEGKTSWGTRIRPTRMDAPNDDPTCWVEVTVDE